MGRASLKTIALLIGLLAWPLRDADAAILTVTTTADTGSGSLRNAIETAAANDEIRFDASLQGLTINLASALPQISRNVTIDGAAAPNLTISGGNQHRIFFVLSGTVTIKNLNLADGRAQGGSGGTGRSGGGGGLGAGGALFVNQGANVTAENIVLQNNAAVGGSGGNGDDNAAITGGGGGGGLGGNGGSSTSAGGGGGGGFLGNGGDTSGTGGGGGGGQRGNGGSTTTETGGGGGGSVGNGSSVSIGIVGGGGGGTTDAIANSDTPGAGGGSGGIAVFSPNGNAGGANGGGGGGARNGSGGNGAVNGGGGGVGVAGVTAGNGALNGGGGGGAIEGGVGAPVGSGDAGNGGDFGGGGGSAGTITRNAGPAGNGGFGGGGGARAVNTFGSEGTGGFGAGDGGLTDLGGRSDGGDGGSGFGGAVFVRQGGSLTIRNGNLPTGNTVTAGTGGSGITSGANGQASGAALYVNDSTPIFDVTGATPVVVANDIAGLGGITKNGTGQLTLQSANTYQGVTQINAGTLRAENNTALGTGNVDGAGGTLDLANGISLANPISLSGNLTISQNDAGAAGLATLTGVVSETAPFGLTKIGAGTIALTGTNTYAGGTTVNAGTLRIAADTNLGAAVGPLTFDNGTLELTNGITSSRATTLNAGGGTFQIGNTTSTFSGVFSGTGNLTVSGANGQLTLSGANTYTGNTVVNNSTLGISNDNSLGAAGGTLTLNQSTLLLNGAVTSARDVSLITSGTINTNGNDATFSGIFSGTSDFIKTGAGTLTLSGANTHTGNNQVLGGTLAISNDNNLGAAANGLTLSNATLLTNASITSTRDVTLGLAGGDVGTIDTNGMTSTFSGVFGGPGALAKTNTGTLILSNANTYLGGTTLSGGTLQLENSNALSTGGLTVIAAVPTPTLDLANGLTVTNNVQLQGDLIVDQSDTGGLATMSGVISEFGGAFGVTKTGVGSLALSGANTYTGGTTINGGEVRITNDNNLGGATGLLTINGGTLRTDLGVTSARNVVLGTNGGTIDTNGNDATFSGVVSGNSNGLTKNGNGVLTLSGSNTYTGGTTVNGGTIAVNSPTSLGAAPGGLTLNNGSTLRTDAALTSNRTITLNAPGGTIDTNGNDVVAAGQITGPGALTKNGAGTLDLTNAANNFAGGTTISAGNLKATTSTLPGNVTNNSTLTLDQSANGTFAGTISGTGALAKSGTGTITLSGNNTYAGGTTINAGTLEGTTETIPGDVTNNGTLSLSQNANGTFAGVISGTGALAKSGTGTVTLSGNNTYSGGTTINSGAIQGTTSTVQGNVANGGQLIFDQNTDGNFAGLISGAGSVVKNGSGVVTFSGNNSYTGGTTISAGTLRGTTMSIPGDIVNNAALIFDQNSNDTFTNIISGSGTLTKLGTGTITMTGANTYTGQTTISAGQLLFSGTNERLADVSDVVVNTGGTLGVDAITETIGSLSGDGNVNIANAGTLRIGASNASTTFGGTTAGTGALEKIGSGTLTLTGTSGHTGMTTVTGGVLQGTVASLPNTITNNAQVVFDQGANATFSGDITGTGSVSKIGAGTLTLGSVNSYTGGTIVDAGSLQGNTTTLVGNITNNANVIFDQLTDGTYASVISGPGTVTKQGAGTLTISGATTYSGTTTVAAGALQVNGTVVGPVDVQSGATLSGTGTVGTTTVRSGSTISPEPAPGSLNVAGNYTQEAGSIYEMQIVAGGTTAGTHNDVIIVSGNANVAGGTVNVTAPTDLTLGAYTILQSGGVTGQFTTINETLPLRDFTQVVNGGNIQLNVTRIAGNFGAMGVTPNEQAVGTALDAVNATATGPLGDVLDQLVNPALTTAQKRQALAGISGDVFASGHQMTMNKTTFMLNQLSQTLRYEPGLTGVSNQQASLRPSTALRRSPVSQADSIQLANAEPWIVRAQNPEFDNYSYGASLGPTPECDCNYWMGTIVGYGIGGDVRANGNATDLNYLSRGTSAVLTRPLGPDVYLGGFLDYANSRGETVIPIQEVNADNIFGGLFVRWTDEFGSQTLIAFGGGHDDYTTRRTIPIVLPAITATANYEGSQGFGYIEHTRRYRWQNQDFRPMLALQRIRSRQNAFTETGGGPLNLTVPEIESVSARILAGARLDRSWTSRRGYRITRYFEGQWAHEFADNVTSYLGTLAGGPTFTTAGLDYGRNWFIGGAGLTWQSSRFEWGIRYQAQANQNVNLHSGALEATLVW